MEGAELSAFGAPSQTTTLTLQPRASPGRDSDECCLQRSSSWRDDSSAMEPRDSTPRASLGADAGH
jgi:hypothetical protein